MNRRGFLQSAILAASALAIDPERLLWTPKKTIFIPPPRLETFIVTNCILDGDYLHYERVESLTYVQMEHYRVERPFDESWIKLFGIDVPLA